MKKYLAFILLFFGIGCICSCTAIDELGDTSCVPEGMIRVEVPLSIASSVQTTEGVTREIEDRWEPIEDLEVQIWRGDMSFNCYTVSLDPSNLKPVTGENGQKQYILKFDIPELVLQGDDGFQNGYKSFNVRVCANLKYFSPYGSTNPTPPISSPVYMSGGGEWRWDGKSDTFVLTSIYLYRSICKLRTLVRTVDKSVLGNWEVFPEQTEVQLLDAPPYARKFHPVMFLDGDYVDPTVYVDYPSMVLRDFPSDQIVDIYLGEHSNTVDEGLFRVYEQYFFENYLQDVSKYKAGVNITSLKVKIPLYNHDTGENKIIERVIPIGGYYGWDDDKRFFKLVRNTAYLLDIQVLSPEDIEVNLHLQDWWSEEIIDGDIPGVSFTVDKTEVPVIPYGVTDPAPAFEVVPDDPAFLDISLVDKDYKSVDQSNGFVLWYKLPKAGSSLTKAPSDNRIRINVTNMGLRMFFTTVKNGNPGGFFRVTCGRSTRYIPIITPKYVRTDEMFNKTMTSNCYIAEKEGGYRFAGTVMGNGADGLPPAVQASMLPYNANGYLMGATPSPVIAPKSAKLLWQDVDGLITQVGFDTNTTSRGDVVFYVSGTKGPGNAVISVYDKADPNDPAAKVLWSWHIWCAPRPEEMSTSGSAAADDDGKRIYTFMDRNLGATTADGSSNKAEGLLYRYGRSVPMIHFASKWGSYRRIYNILGEDITSLIVWGEGPGGNYTGRNWDNILFPLNYYTAARSNLESGMWGEGAVSEVGTFDDKTIYDPCPPGYKVPTYRAFEALNELYYSQNKFRQESSGIYFTGLKGGTLCFPWVDYFWGEPGTAGQWYDTRGKSLTYYSATIDGVSDNTYPGGIYTFYYLWQSDPGSRSMLEVIIDSTTLLPVRCVREREKE